MSHQESENKSILAQDDSRSPGKIWGMGKELVLIPSTDDRQYITISIVCGILFAALSILTCITCFWRCTKSTRSPPREHRRLPSGHLVSIRQPKFA